MCLCVFVCMLSCVSLARVFVCARVCMRACVCACDCVRAPTCLSCAVMRTQGSLRLILNTKLWPQMQVDKASEKSIRITAMDTEDQGLKVFLISVGGTVNKCIFKGFFSSFLGLYHDRMV